MAENEKEVVQMMRSKEHSTNSSIKKIMEELIEEVHLLIHHTQRITQHHHRLSHLVETTLQGDRLLR